jgi:hypothetical protein
LGNLQALRELRLTRNQLAALPESLWNLQALQALDLIGNQLSELPASLGNLQGLGALYLDGNQLAALPESLGNLTALQALYLSDNQLTALPESLRNLAALRNLFLSGNPLRELPNFLRTLNLEVHDLPFSVSIESITQEICRLAQVEPSDALESLYTEAADHQKELLKTWISRLKDTAPGRAQDTRFYQSIVNILKVAATNPPFTQTFWNVIEGAGATCGDRMALSILDLDVAKQLMELNPQKHLQVAAFLREGAWPYALLKEHAIQKVVELQGAGRTFDEIEVHLGYPINLREALRLPIAPQEMLYFTCSCLTDDDLEIAKASVLEKMGNEDEFITYLIDQDKWKETLQLKHPNEVAAIENQYDTDYEATQDIVQAMDGKVASLKELTRRLLQEPENPVTTSVKRRRVGARELKALGISPASLDSAEDPGEGRRKMVTRSSTKAPQ